MARSLESKEKVLGPFVKMTQGVDEAQWRKVAIQAFLIATVGGLVAAFLGQSLLQNWRVSLPTLMLAAGLVLLLVALQQVLAPFDPPTPAPPPAVPVAAGEPPAGTTRTLPPGLAVSPLAFPTLVTPYGAATLILLLAGRLLGVLPPQ